MVDIKDFFDKKFTYAIIGASNNEEKYGFKIYEILKQNNFKVIPINPKEKLIQGDKCYKSLEDYGDKIDIVDFIVPPKVTFHILESLLKLNIKKVWFQPGSYDEKCEKFAKKNKIKYIKEFCLYKKMLNKF